MFVQTSSELAVRAKIESRQVLEWCHQIIPALGEKLGETSDEMHRAFPPLSTGDHVLQVCME